MSLPRHPPRIAAVLAVLALLAGCGTLTRPPPPAPDEPAAAPAAPRRLADLPPPVARVDPPGPEPLGPVPLPAPAAAVQTGIASWYGPRFHGRRTASGERFDMHAMTAAHRSLPFGTRARVRNPANGQEVVVRINDRGPFTRGRIVDLSRAAARLLGIAGIAPVELQPLTDAEVSAAAE